MECGKYSSGRRTLIAADALEASRGKEAAGEAAPMYSIKTVNGKTFVEADRDLRITGDDPKQWGKQVEAYINNKIRGGQDVILPTTDGHMLVLTGRSAYKLTDRHKATIAKRIGEYLNDSDYRTKLNAAGHIDELIQVATFRNGQPDKKTENTKMI